MAINKAWIDEMRALCDVATPGPWEVTGFYKTQVAPTVGKGSTVCAAATNNANFIAAARTALPAALDALEAAQKEIARLTAERDAAVKDFKASIETDHCQYCKNMEKCEQKAEREQTYA